MLEALIAPAAMIAAAALLVLALYYRLGAIVNRARNFAKERFETYTALSRLDLDSQTGGSAHLYRSRISSLDRQVEHILHRAKLLRTAIICLLLAVSTMLAASVLLGLSVWLPAVAAVAVVIFYLGVLVMIAPMVLAVIELARSLDPVVLEQVDTGEMGGF